jgi:hypothetical protein
MTWSLMMEKGVLGIRVDEVLGLTIVPTLVAYWDRSLSSTFLVDMQVHGTRLGLKSHDPSSGKPDLNRHNPAVVLEEVHNIVAEWTSKNGYRRGQPWHWCSHQGRPLDYAF